MAIQEVAKEVAEKVGEVIITNIGKKIIIYTGKDHGSKVKMGAYAECPIELFGDKACIVVNGDMGNVILLTSDNIRSCRYVKEKKRGIPRHTYFYYNIVFKNGEESYVRMRRKYRDAMENYL